MLREAEAADTQPYQAILAIRLLLLTGCRLSEILSLRWDAVDFDRQCLRLAETKTGAKVVPAGPPALELLAAVPRIQGNPFVLPGRKPGSHFVGLPKVWGRIRESAGLEDVRLHDLRHSYAAVGAGGGWSLPIIGKLLGHTQSRTTKRYAHLADDPVYRAADTISREISAALGEPQDDPGELGSPRESP